MSQQTQFDTPLSSRTLTAMAQKSEVTLFRSVHDPKMAPPVVAAKTTDSRSAICGPRISLCSASTTSTTISASKESPVPNGRRPWAATRSFKLGWKWRRKGNGATWDNGARSTATTLMQFVLVMCCMERTHDSDPTPTIVSPIAHKTLWSSKLCPCVCVWV